MPLDIFEASIADCLKALKAGEITSVELTALALDRIAKYDRQNTCLNAVPILNPDAFRDALLSDERRRAGQVGLLEGIPYTAKDSYSCEGLTVASGSPAFETLIASQDAFVIAKIREAGGILLGKTNMPPMAAGGMQRGLYGRAESPYNKDYLPAAFASGSSNGSGVATTTSMGVFGLGEETVSSGRSPASNCGLAAYTPSRGVLSIKGNWPLYPTCDVVVPHCKTMQDMLDLLNVIMQEDNEKKGDFWREQGIVPIPPVSSVRPSDFLSLADPSSLQGKRFGVPKMYISKDPQSNIVTRQSVMDLWNKAANDLKALGAELVEVDFPLVTKYESGPISFLPALLSDEWNHTEMTAMMGVGWNRFLQLNAKGITKLTDVPKEKIFPIPKGSMPDKTGGTRYNYPAIYDASCEYSSFDSIPGFQEALKKLESIRRTLFEDWLDFLKLDGLVFPANADVPKQDSDVNPTSSKEAWQNGNYLSNGNRVWRHFGIPTTSCTMGVMQDTLLPVNVTFASKAQSDCALLSWAWAFEQYNSKRRQAPKLTPALPARQWHQVQPSLSSSDGQEEIQVSLNMIPTFQGDPLLEVTFKCSSAKAFSITCNGESLSMHPADEGSWKGENPVQYPTDHRRREGEIALPEWSPAMLVILVHHITGVKTGKVIHLSEYVPN